PVVDQQIVVDPDAHAVTGVGEYLAVVIGGNGDEAFPAHRKLARRKTRYSGIAGAPVEIECRIHAFDGRAAEIELRVITRRHSAVGIGTETRGEAVGARIRADN